MSRTDGSPDERLKSRNRTLSFSRGGGPVSSAFDQRIAALLAGAAIRLGITPNQISLASGAVGLTTSAAVIAVSESSTVLAAIIGLVGWHLAYTLDCADGQVARATKQSSPGGAVLDLLVDFLVHTSVAIALMSFFSVAWSPDAHARAAILIAAALLYPLYWEALVKQLPEDQRPSKRQGIGAAISLLRDYSLHITVLPLAIVFSEAAFYGLLVLICSLHFLALLGRIASLSAQKGG